VVEVAGGAVDDAAGGDPHPQRAATVPAAQVAAGAAGQRRQRGGLRAPWRRRLNRVECAPEEVGRHDAGGAGTDVDSERQERLVVDPDGHARPADRTGDGEVGPFTQNTGIEQRGDLTVHRGDAQLGDLGDDVTRDRTAQARGTEHRGGRPVSDPQRRRDDVVPGEQRALGVSGRGLAESCGGAHGDVLCRSRRVGPGHTPRLRGGPSNSTQTANYPGSVRRG
jgi:hypothetical protein